MNTTADIENLLSRLTLGDRKALSQLYDKTSAKLFGVCLRVLNDRAAAEDALQDTFVKVWKRADRYAANGLSPMTWLITIARNTAIDSLRRRKTAGEDLSEADAVPSAGPTPEAAAIASSEAARIGACMDTLEPDRRAAVRGAYLEGQTYADLAKVHDVTLNTMRTWLRRSLEKLRECLSQ